MLCADRFPVQRGNNVNILLPKQSQSKVALPKRAMEAAAQALEEKLERRRRQKRVSARKRRGKEKQTELDLLEKHRQLKQRKKRLKGDVRKLKVWARCAETALQYYRQSAATAPPAPTLARPHSPHPPTVQPPPPPLPPTPVEQLPPPPPPPPVQLPQPPSPFQPSPSTLPLPSVSPSALLQPSVQDTLYQETTADCTEEVSIALLGGDEEMSELLSEPDPVTNTVKDVHLGLLEQLTAMNEMAMTPETELNSMVSTSGTFKTHALIHTDDHKEGPSSHTGMHPHIPFAGQNEETLQALLQYCLPVEDTTQKDLLRDLLLFPEEVQQRAPIPEYTLGSADTLDIITDTLEPSFWI